MITDLQLYEFLRKLLDDQRGSDSLNLTEWEQRFVASFRMAERQMLWLTGDFFEGRRAVVDRLWQRYGAELNFPHPLDTVAERPKLADADPDGCEYIMRDDGRQARCNAPAEYQEPGRLRYCEAHARAVEQDCKRAKIRLSLITYRPSTLNSQPSTPP